MVAYPVGVGVDYIAASGMIFYVLTPFARILDRLGVDPGLLCSGVSTAYFPIASVLGHLVQSTVWKTGGASRGAERWH